MTFADPKMTAGFTKAGTATAERHAFFCLGPDCCATADGEAAWEHLKRLVAQTGAKAMRTKAACFRVCSGGPWLLVYPEGTWYGGITPERLDHIVAEHLVAGRIVEKWAIVQKPLCTLAAQ